MKKNTFIIILSLVFANVSHANPTSQQTDSDTFYDLFAGTIIEKTTNFIYMRVNQ